MRPMLAPNDETLLDLIRWPKFGSFKLDGVRGVVQGGVVLSRKLKPIPNEFVQYLYGRPEYEGLDGELTVGLPYGEGLMQRTMSGVMSKHGEPEVWFHVFDRVEQGKAYSARFVKASQQINEDSDRISMLKQIGLHSIDEMLAFETAALEIGYEGIMLRDPASDYKFGRATQRENTLLKIKRFVDSEAVVLGFTEEMQNNNPQQINELGLTKRQTLQENMVGKNTLGGILCRDIHSGVEFSCSSGNMDEKQKQWTWDNRETLVGEIFTYKSFPIGVKDKPRFPGFKSWRSPLDMGE